MTNPTQPNFFSDFFKQGSSGDGTTTTDPKFFELCLKALCYMIEQIPYLGSWFINAYADSMDRVPDPDLTKIDAFCAYPCPTYLTAGQINHLRGKISTRYGQLMAKSMPDYAVCYSRLHVISEDAVCQQILTDKVTTFYQIRRPIHMGKPNDDKRPTLSPDFVNVCITFLPPLNLSELYIHGPIENDDRDKLKGLIISIHTLATLHLEVKGNSAVYFTLEAMDILKKNRTITTFNLHLMGEKRELKSKSTLPWHSMNYQTRCNFHYHNAIAPEGIDPQQLTFH